MILVAGGSGYVGSIVVPRLAEAGHQVRVLSRGTRRLDSVASVGGDVASGEGLEEALEGCDAVLNLVAIIVERGQQTFDRVNAQGSRHLVEAAKRQGGISRYLHVSAIGVRPDPSLGYLSSKYAGERAVIDSGLPHTVFRPSILFGPGHGQHFFSIVAKLVRAAPVVPVPGSGQARFQPLALDDLASCIVQSIGDERHRDRVYELAGPDQLTYDQIVDIVAAVLGKRRAKLHVPLALMKPAVAVMEKVLPNPSVTSDQLRSLGFDNVAQDNALETAFGIPPRRLSEGLDYIRG